MKRAGVATLIAVGLMLLLPLAQVEAQSVRGRVVDAITHAPLPGALVELRDAKGAMIAQQFTSPSGGFALDAPQPGHYRLAVADIGYGRRMPQEIDVAGEPLQLGDLALSPLTISLPELQAVAGKRSCSRNDQNQLVLANLLGSAQTSLQLMDAALHSRSVAFQMRLIHTVAVQKSGHDSSLSADTSGATLHEWPVRSLSPDSIRLVGFARRMTPAEGSGHVYYGPDLQVLFSDAFMEHHCFTVDSKRTTRDTIVVKFEPAGRPKLPDLSGTLILDRATLTMRRMTYEHQALPDQIPDHSAGGDMLFSELTPGLWLPTAWSIWSPITRMERIISRPVFVTMNGRGGPPVMPAYVSSSIRVTIVGRNTVSGQVLRVVPMP